MTSPDHTVDGPTKIEEKAPLLDQAVDDLAAIEEDTPLLENPVDDPTPISSVQLAIEEKASP